MNKENPEERARKVLKESLERLRQTNWWIITGGPSTGKSAVIKNLAKRGYKTMPEAARVDIDSKLDKGRTIEQIRADEVEFQIDVLRMKERIEDETPENELIFWDRGLAGDSMAYWFLARRPKGTPVNIYDSETTINAKRRYQGIFLLDQLPSYEQDYARVEDKVKAAKVHGLIGSMYEFFGYEPIRVPVFPGNEAVSVNERAQFVIDCVGKINPNVPNLPYPFPIPFQGSLAL